MAFCDIFQPSLYLACADKRGEIYDNDSVVSRFFWGNTGVFFLIIILDTQVIKLFINLGLLI